MLELQGRIAALDEDDPQRHVTGRVRFVEEGHEHGDRVVVERVRRGRGEAPDGFLQVDVGDAFVYPGLTDLHSHLGFATLPLWHEPERTLGPWLHRDNWPDADSYKPGVSWPAYAYLKGAPEELLAYAQVRALAGGTTSIQGWPNANTAPQNQLVRSVDDGVDPDAVRVSVQNLTSSELDDRRQLLDDDRTLVYHLCEGQRGSKVTREFADVATAGCLRHRLIAIHCSAVGEAEFRQWNVHADLAEKKPPGGVVWSPFSNLWLYNQTTDVVAARRHGVSVCIGSDWGPSGTKNLLGELKVALTWLRHAGVQVSPFELAEMVTSTPGDLLVRAWGVGPGRLAPGRLADAVVITARHADPWTNLVLARERDVQLVVVDGQARYGTRALMRAAGATGTTAVRVGAVSRHVSLRDPADAARPWSWAAVMRELQRVQRDPVKAIDDGLDAEANFVDVTTPTTPRRLILESDMPGGPNSVAGPPPAGVTFDAPPLPTLAHDAAWFSAVRGTGFHDGVLDDLDDLFASGARL